MNQEQEYTPTLAVHVGNTSYVWDERVDQRARAVKRSRERAASAFNIAVLAAMLVSVALFFYRALVATDPGELITAAFWTHPSSAGLFLSFALLFGTFFFYRLAEQSRQKVQMPSVEDLPAVSSFDPSDRTVSRVNVARLFQPQAHKSVEEAHALAERYGNAQLEPIHLFVGAMSADDVPVLFARLGLPFGEIKESLANRLASREGGGSVALSTQAEETLLAAFANAAEQNRQAVSAVEVFYEAYKRDEYLRELLFDKGIDERRLANVVEWLRITGKLRERYDAFRRAAFFKPTGAMNRSMTAVATPDLDAYGEDLTTAAVNGQLPMLVGREREMDELLRVIEGGRQSVVLVGPSGVGKTAILSGVAERMVEESVPDLLKDKRLVSLSIPTLLSGAAPAEAQDRLMRALVDVARSRNIILVLPNVDQLPNDLAALLADVLSRGITFVIATTTPQGYVATVERSVLGRVFQKVNVPEPDTDTAIRIVESKIGTIEYDLNAIFSYEAVEKAVELSDRYIHESYLPKKAVEVCREAAIAAVRERGQNALVTAEDVSRIVGDKTGVPVGQVNEEERDKLLNLEEHMHGRVVGQDEAVKAVAAALRRARANMGATNRPIATFLFLGPTGVGKTELAKTIAATYFGNEDAMLRFDMSEYTDRSSIDRLIGAPGAPQGGLLTEAVRRHPFSIVLLDEFEKAHPDILNVFLQVFDDGRLTDSLGRTIDFTNTILVVTSNAGSEYVQDAIASNTPIEQIKTHLLETELRGIYRPELLNRFDGLIVFRPLTMDDVTQIAYLMVSQVAERLEPKGIHFRATDEAVMELARKGFDPKFGARPLRRVVQEEVDNAIAKALLEGKAGRRDTIVLKPGGEIEIEKAAAL